MNRTLTILCIVAMFLAGSCSKEKSYELGAVAKGSLQNSSGDCLAKSISGTYVAGKTLNDSNYINVALNISQTGSYSIATDTVNGFFFMGTGNISTTGQVNVQLKGSGTPKVTGPNTFTLRFDSTFCALTITVLATDTSSGGGVDTTGGGGNVNGDLFPLSANSWWSYDDPTISRDTVKTVNAASATLNGTNYRMFVDSDLVAGAALDTFYYRKSGNDYYTYTFVDVFSVIPFDSAVHGDILFLKEGMNTGDTWNSSEFSGKVNGTPAKLRYTFNCTSANATATVNGQTVNGAYTVVFKPQASMGTADYSDEGVTYTALFVKGIGLVDLKIETAQGLVGDKKIRSWQVF
jgi:hypothetical protein